MNRGTTSTYNIDNIRVTPVPEPASLAILTSGLAGLGIYRTRRRARA